MMAKWTFLASHARALPCIAHDPEVRLRDIAASRGITERSAHGTVTDPAKVGYVARQKNGRRNRYQTRAHLPLPEPGSQERHAGTSRPFLAGDWAGAARLWTDLGCPYEAGLALLGSADEASLREALRIFTDLGAFATVRLTRQKMRRLGIRSIPAGPRPATREHPLGLTHRTGWPA